MPFHLTCTITSLPLNLHQFASFVLKTAQTLLCMPSLLGLMVPLSSAPRAEEVRLGRGCGLRARGRGQPRVKEGQLTTTSCSQHPAVSSICYAVITQTSLFSSQVSKLPGHTEFWKTLLHGYFPPDASFRI